MDQKPMEAEVPDRALIEGLLGLPPEVVKGIYVFGSHAFGTATPQSDWDFYGVVDGYVGPLTADVEAKEKKEEKEEDEATTPSSDIPDRPEELRWEALFSHGNIDMTLYEAGNWQEMLDYQDLHSILCQYFLPSSLVFKNSPERFSWSLDAMRLKHSLNAYVWSHHILSKKFFQRKKHVRARKCLVHCIRSTLMAISLLENNGTAVDFSVNDKANEYYREVMQFDAEKMSWRELDHWFHLIYHPLRCKFRERANAYRKKLAVMKSRGKQAQLDTIDYIRLSLQDESHTPSIDGVRRNDLSFLKRELSMRVGRHHKLPNLVQLNQQPHSSPTRCNVSRECSGLVLDEDADWQIACFGFPRLFHYNEDEEQHLPLITSWDKVRIYEIEPGISTTLYWYSGQWLVSSTSNSFIGRCLRKRERARIRTDEKREMDEGRDWNWFVEKLFWAVWQRSGYRLPEDKDKCYMFRLVTQGTNVEHLLSSDHAPEASRAENGRTREKLVLVGVRDRTTLRESLPEKTAHEHGWACAVERRDMAELAVQWAKQGQPSIAELEELARRGGGAPRPSPSGAKSVPAEETDDAKRQKYVLSKLEDKCWELNVLEVQGIIVCDPDFNRIVVHTPAHTALSSLGPYTHRHGKEEYFTTLVRTTFYDQERFCSYYAEWAHWYRYVHALLKHLCDETDTLYIETLSKMGNREIGEWYNLQRKLNTKESKRSKLLKLICKANKPPDAKTKGSASAQQQHAEGEAAPELGEGSAPMKLTTLSHYLNLEGIKNVHISKGLEGFLFSAYNQQLKPTRKRYATRRLPAMPLHPIPDCPLCAPHAASG